MSQKSLELIEAFSVLFLEMMSSGVMPSRDKIITAAECLDKVLTTAKPVAGKKVTPEATNTVETEYVDRPPGLCVKIFATGVRAGQQCPNKAIFEGCCGIHKLREKKGEKVKAAAQTSEKKVTAKFNFNTKKDETLQFEPLEDNNNDVPTFTAPKDSGVFKPQSASSDSSSAGKPMNFTSKLFTTKMAKNKPVFFQRQFNDHSFVFTTDDLCRNLVFADYDKIRTCIAMIKVDCAINENSNPLPDDFADTYMIPLELTDEQCEWCVQNKIAIQESEN